MHRPSGLGFGQLLLALDRTMVDAGRRPPRPGHAGRLGRPRRRRRRPAGSGGRRRFRATCSSCWASPTPRRCAGWSSSSRAPEGCRRPSSSRNPPTPRSLGPSRSAPRSWPSTRGRAGSRSTDWSTTPSNTTATAATHRLGAPTCSGSPSRSPTAPAAWSASRTNSPTCWRTRRPATKPTNCAG